MHNPIPYMSLRSDVVYRYQLLTALFVLNDVNIKNLRSNNGFF